MVPCHELDKPAGAAGRCSKNRRSCIGNVHGHLVGAHGAPDARLIMGETFESCGESGKDGRIGDGSHDSQLTGFARKLRPAGDGIKKKAPIGPSCGSGGRTPSASGGCQVPHRMPRQAPARLTMNQF